MPGWPMTIRALPAERQRRPCSRRSQPGHHDRELAEHPCALRQPCRQHARSCAGRPRPIPLAAAGLTRSAPRTGLADRDRHRHRRLQQQRRLGIRQQAGHQSRDGRFRIFTVLDQVAPGRIERRPRELRGRPPPNRYRPLLHGFPCSVIKRHVLSAPQDDRSSALSSMTERSDSAAIMAGAAGDPAPQSPVKPQAQPSGSAITCLH
jgi:hypothetical protein